MNQTRCLWPFPAAWLDILDIPYKWCRHQTGPASVLHWDINLLGSQNSSLQQHNWICPQESRHCLCGAGTLYVHLHGMSYKGRPAVIKVLLGYFQNSNAFWRLLQSLVCNFKAVNLNIPLLFFSCKWHFQIHLYMVALLFKILFKIQLCSGPGNCWLIPNWLGQ